MKPMTLSLPKEILIAELPKLGYKDCIKKKRQKKQHEKRHCQSNNPLKSPTSKCCFCLLLKNLTLAPNNPLCQISREIRACQRRKKTFTTIFHVNVLFPLKYWGKRILIILGCVLICPHNKSSNHYC